MTTVPGASRATTGHLSRGEAIHDTRSCDNPRCLRAAQDPRTGTIVGGNRFYCCHCTPPRATAAAAPAAPAVRPIMGSRVQWESRSSGEPRTYTGTVVCVLPADRPLPSAWRSKLPNAGYLARDHESYIVLADPVPGRRNHGRPHNWPLVARLKVIA